MSTFQNMLLPFGMALQCHNISNHVSCTSRLGFAFLDSFALGFLCLLDMFDTKNMSTLTLMA